jgi:hypothetical protein
VASEQNNRARALIAIGALATFGILIAVILLAGGDDGADVAAAPEECVEAWNGDPHAVSNGVHNFNSHGYASVQVAYANEDGTEIAPSPVDGGGCVVVFAAQALDPEPVAAAEIKLAKRWVPLSYEAELDRLAELQSDAMASANAQLSEDGTLAPLDSG